MKRIITLLTFLFSIFIIANGQEKDTLNKSDDSNAKEFRYIKSIDHMHGVLQRISQFYVEDEPLDTLVYRGIKRMLYTLDPYTEFYDETDMETLNLMTTGSYGGIGAMIRKKPNEGILITEPYENTPAQKSGINAGDVILKIDGKDILGLNAEEASAAMKGVPGTNVTFTIKHIKGGDTTDVVVTRERIHIPDVAISTMLKDSIGYIDYTAFTDNGFNEFKSALTQLNEQGMKGLIIDLRGNGGGLMDEAVKILSLFLPQNTEVVSARGRLPQTNFTCFTKDEPLLPDMPIAILVNHGTASAAEILSGAMQDLDRAVIIGSRTFGKGLIQSVEDLNYGAKVKVTTAKYYIPSGRCIQAIDYSHRNADGSVGYIPDSLTKEFKTARGRKVFDGGGITPDIKIEYDTLSRVTLALYANDYLFDYSLEYYKRHDSITPATEFRLTDAEYNEFIEYMADKKLDHRTESEIAFEKFELAAKDEGIDQTALKEIKALKAKLTNSFKQDLLHFKPEIKELLEGEICCRFYLGTGRLQSHLTSNDRQLQKAIEILNDNTRYNTILNK